MMYRGRSIYTLLLVGLAACTSRPADEEMDSTEGSTEGPTAPSSATMTTASTTAVADSGETDPMNTTTGVTTATTTVTTATDTNVTTIGTITDSVTDSDTDVPGVSFELEIQPIFDEHCVVCHSDEPGAEWSFLDLSPGDAYSSIVGPMSTQATSLSFIEPGEPELSYLWHKINDTQSDAGGGGLDMPKMQADGTLTALTPEQFELLLLWIEEGAPL